MLTEHFFIMLVCAEAQFFLSCVTNFFLIGAKRSREGNISIFMHKQKKKISYSVFIKLISNIPNVHNFTFCISKGK